MEITLIKRSNQYLTPCLPEDAEKIGKLKNGVGLKCKITKKRNIAFHRKYFALLNFAFDVWDPGEEKGNAPFIFLKIEKNFEQFRADVTILAGYYHATFALDGTMKMLAKSISFDSMDEDEFEKLYDKTVDVILKNVLRNYTKEDVNDVVNELIGFT